MRCHQCGSLFSTTGNPSCSRFDRGDVAQAGEWGAGEACLWYSWERSRGRTSYVRECFSTSILLGTVSDPLLPSASCSPRDISETASSAKISACLCTSDLCNSYVSPEEARELARPATTTRPPTRPPQTRRTTRRTTRRPTRRTTRPPVPEEQPRRIGGLPGGRPSVHPDMPGLQCYSCGSLLNPNKKCDQFNRTARAQVQTCLTDEACLMYTWQKSPTETGRPTGPNLFILLRWKHMFSLPTVYTFTLTALTPPATLRECFPTRVLLGSIDNPLSPSSSCSMVRVASSPPPPPPQTIIIFFLLYSEGYRCLSLEQCECVKS